MRSLPQPLPIGPGQESVWDYPRPPRLERARREIRVLLGGRVVAHTTQAWRVVETSHPPTYYVPADDCAVECFERAPGASVCEWKGEAVYWTVRAGDAVAVRACWSYPRPTPAFASIRDHRAFYPAAFSCFVDGERVRAQPGRFYGGWVTDDVVGPFKGEPGSERW